MATFPLLQVMWRPTTIWGLKLSSKICGCKQLNRLTRARPRTVGTMPFPRRLYLLSCLYLTSGPALSLKGIKRERKRRKMKTQWICFQHWSHSCLELQRVVRETFFSILMLCSPLRHNQEASIFSNKLKPTRNESGFLLAISKVIFFPWLICFLKDFVFLSGTSTHLQCQTTATVTPVLWTFFFFYFSGNRVGNGRWLYHPKDNQKWMCSSKDTMVVGWWNAPPSNPSDICIFFYLGVRLRDVATSFGLSEI